MKQMRWAVVAWILAASTAWAATGVFHNGATTNATGSNISTADKGSMGIAVTISGTATVTFQGSADNGTTWANMNCVALGTTANVTSTVASGHYQCSVGGLTHVQTPISGCSGCTVTVRVNTSLASRGGGGGGGSAIAVQEIDGAPTVGGVTGIKVTNGSLTDNGDGTVTIATSGAANLTIGVSTVTGGTAGSILTVGAGPLAQQVAITGLVKGNGTSQPTAAVAGTDYVAPAGNVATATALAANGANCAAGLAPLGVDASGAAETCTDYMEEPAANGIVAKTGANTSAARTDTGTANQIDVTNGNGVAGNPTFALSSTLVIPGPGIEFSETAGDATCAAGNYWIKANSTTGNFRKCQNGTATDLDTGGAGGTIGGSTGATDNAVIRANGTGGATVQSSGCTIDDSAALTCSGGFIAGTSGVGTIALLEGTAPGANATASTHNLYINSSNSTLETHENGGSLKTYLYSGGALGTPSSGTLTNATGLPISSGVSGLGTGVATVLATPSSSNLIAAITDETGTGALVFGTGASIGTPTITSATINSSTIDSPTITTKMNVPRGTAFPGSPAAGDVLVITDDSTVGACDSAAGSAVSLCYYTGAAWAKLGDGTAAGGALSSTDIDTSAELRTILTDESGTGALLFAGGAIGAATATTAAANDNTTLVATTAYVQTELIAYASDSVTFTNKTLTSPVISSISNTGTLTLPTSTDTLVGRATTDTLTNKTLTNPVISTISNSGTVTLFTATDTVVGKATTDTLTNKTLDCTSAGNVCTITKTIDLPLVGVSGGTAGHVWDDAPTLTACTPGSAAGTNQTVAYCTFPDSDGDIGRAIPLHLPSSFVADSVTFIVEWKTTGTGNARFRVRTICYASDEAGDSAYSNSSYVTAAAGTSGRWNKSASTAVTTTGCAASETMWVQFERNRTEASDTLNAALDVRKVILAWQEAQ